MILVIDLEATCWDDEKYPECKTKQQNEMEIIEIGAVLMFPLDMSNGYSFETISFSQFIKPVRNPILTDFYRNYPRMPTIFYLYFHPLNAFQQHTRRLVKPV